MQLLNNPDIFNDIFIKICSNYMQNNWKYTQYTLNITLQNIKCYTCIHQFNKFFYCKVLLRCWFFFSQHSKSCSLIWQTNLWRTNVSTFPSRISSFYVGLVIVTDAARLAFENPATLQGISNEAPRIEGSSTVYPVHPSYSRVRFRNVRISI